MHPTADTPPVINSQNPGAAGDAWRYAAVWREGMNGTGGPGGRDMIAPRANVGGSWTPHNSGMHPTADTIALMLRESLGAAGDAGR
jgi:hypothetical protein